MSAEPAGDDVSWAMWIRWAAGEAGLPKPTDAEVAELLWEHTDWPMAAAETVMDQLRRELVVRAARASAP